MLCLAIMGTYLGTIPPLTDMPATCARFGWMRRLLILRGRGMELASMAGFLRPQIQGFQQCSVTWETPSAPLVDISSFERKPETNYGTTDTKADQTDAYVDPNAAQTDAYADTKAEQTDGSYSDDSAPVKITQDTYTDDNAKLVTDNTDGYAEEKTADIVEEIKTAPY